MCFAPLVLSALRLTFRPGLIPANEFELEQWRYDQEKTSLKLKSEKRAVERAERLKALQAAAAPVVDQETTTETSVPAAELKQAEL